MRVDVGDERAKEPQPVASCLGPRFYDWQLTQSPEESWRECHLHARNLLGEEGYTALLNEIEGKEEGAHVAEEDKPAYKEKPENGLGGLGDLPLFQSQNLTSHVLASSSH